MVYLALLLLPSILSFIALTLVTSGLDYMSSSAAFSAGALTVFGPWATLVAKATNIPNAGEFFNLPLSLGLTFSLCALVYISVVVGKRWVNVLCVVAYIPLILFWVFSGFGQLMNCIE